jgi:hypothetical protein
MRENFGTTQVRVAVADSSRMLKTCPACHSEESAILIGGRRGISQALCFQREIPHLRSAPGRNGNVHKGFFSILLNPAALQGVYPALPSI